MAYRKPVVIDGKGHLLGRLASVVAKQLLQGQKVSVVRCEQMNISGTFFRNKLYVLSYLRKKFMSNPKRGGPEHYRAPSKMFFKAVRGMMPHRTTRGKAALARLYVFDGVPPQLQAKKKMVVPAALKALRLRPRSKFCVLGDLAKATGWKRSEVVERLEKQRLVRARKWHNARKQFRKLDSKARADPSVKNSESSNILRSYGY
eukprot:TRINITY_DN8714_c0_g1_i1.p1 TRINITY_DN8714_c0_g1~~TRINITY_DN8714_c0_g1_i1.p1  ORF type:complete len:203 (+),score=38.72 TRINITY_DN8714_c0_g1_i1:51-659(+)